MGTTGPVSGHGGEAGIEVVPIEVAAGDRVTVFGEDLEPSAVMALHLLTADGDELMGEPMTDADGHFSFPLTLPMDLAERVYELRLTAPSGASSSTFVTVVAPEAADGALDSRLAAGGGLLTAGVLGLAGIALLALAWGTGRGRRRS